MSFSKLSDGYWKLNLIVSFAHSNKDLFEMRSPPAKNREKVSEIFLKHTKTAKKNFLLGTIFFKLKMTIGGNEVFIFS